MVYVRSGYHFALVTNMLGKPCCLIDTAPPVQMGAAIKRALAALYGLVNEDEFWVAHVCHQKKIWECGYLVCAYMGLIICGNSNPPVSKQFCYFRKDTTWRAGWLRLWSEGSSCLVQQSAQKWSVRAMSRKKTKVQGGQGWTLPISSTQATAASTSRGKGKRAKRERERERATTLK